METPLNCDEETKKVLEEADKDAIWAKDCGGDVEHPKQYRMTQVLARALRSAWKSLAEADAECSKRWREGLYRAATKRALVAEKSLAEAVKERDNFKRQSACGSCGGHHFNVTTCSKCVFRPRRGREE